MRRHLVLFLAATLGTTAVACGSDNKNPSLGPTDTNVVGSYNLTSAGGSTLPYLAFQDGVDNWNVTSAKLVLMADNTWVDSISYSLVAVADGSLSSVLDAGSGVYQISNSAINFVQTTPTSGGSFIGSVSGNTLTVLNTNNQLYVYTK
jgi:hypothetical protein